MAYFWEKFSLLNGSWSVHLLIPGVTSPVDPYGYITSGLEKPTNLCLPLDCMDGQSDHTPYKIVTQRHQIDDGGKLIVSKAWNIRQQVSSTQNEGAALEGVRYATQYDFDKFCFENPDERFPLDWNAEVYKAFMSSISGTYTSAENGALP